MKHGGRSVFVGNIDFDVPEEKVIQELSAVGKVLNFRMVYDKQTKKSKGYGFCEFENPLIAETAMKTLKISFNGRPVKINYAENDLPSKPIDTAARPQQIENIIAVLDTMDKDTLKEVILYIRKMAIDRPSQLRELFDNNPQLVIAVIATLLQLELVKPDKIEEVISAYFDPAQLKKQIAARITAMKEEDLVDYTEDVKNRIMKLKQLITKKKE